MCLSSGESGEFKTQLSGEFKTIVVALRFVEQDHDILETSENSFVAFAALIENALLTLENIVFAWTFVAIE